MSSIKLPLSSVEHSSTSLFSDRTPIHVTFNAADNTVCILHQSGFAELWVLQPRLEAQRGKALVPSKLWSGLLESQPGSYMYKQICALPLANGSQRLAYLTQSKSIDVIVVLDIQETHKTAISLPSHGRIVYSSTNIYWQAADGRIYLGNVSSIW